ncbi:MAG: 3-dehydroquinate synthase [Planctomycetota bacterium]|jgi:3-dehydroquinate synthase
MSSKNITTNEIHDDFDVRFTHRLMFDRDVLAADNPTIDAIFTDGSNDDPRPGMIVAIDDGLAAANPGIEDAIRRRFDPHHLPEIREILEIPGGEAAKNDPAVTDRMLEAIERHRIDRRSYVAVFGGGAVIDAVGFASSTAHRGVRLIRFPSTVLGQLDAAIGVKNGINRFGKKNFVGAFDVPVAVICDEGFLESLDDRRWREGFSEAVKIACLQDAAFFDEIEEAADRIRERDPDASRPIIQRCAELHLRHIASGGDPFERREARPLDFGHWSAHRLESMSDFARSHGEAVAIGVCLDAAYSHFDERLDRGSLDRILDTTTRLGLPIFDSLLRDQGLIDGLEEFREHLGGRLTVTLLEGIGRGVDVHEMDLERLCRSIAHLESNAPA